MGYGRLISMYRAVLSTHLGKDFSNYNDVVRLRSIIPLIFCAAKFLINCLGAGGDLVGNLFCVY